jgi:hypothetical protein
VRKVISACGAIVALLAACTADPSPEQRSLLRAPGPCCVGVKAPRAHSGVDYVFLLRTLCTTGKGIRIMSVRPAAATGGMRVVTWGVHHVAGTPYDSSNPEWVAYTGPVSKMPGFGHGAVTAQCGSRADVDELAVSMAADVPPATASGVLVRYEAGAGIRTVFSQYDIKLCPTSSCP